MTGVRGSSGAPQYVTSLVQQKQQSQTINEKDIAEVQAAILRDGVVQDEELQLFDDLLKNRTEFSDQALAAAPEGEFITDAAQRESFVARSNLENVERVRQLGQQDLSPEAIQARLPALQERIDDLSSNIELLRTAFMNSSNPEHKEFIQLKMEVMTREMNVYASVHSSLEESTRIHDLKELELQVAETIGDYEPIADEPITEESIEEAEEQLQALIEGAPEPSPEEEEMVQRLRESLNAMRDQLAEGQAPSLSDAQEAVEAAGEIMTHIESQGLSDEEQAQLRENLAKVVDSSSSVDERLTALLDIVEAHGEGLGDLNSYLQQYLPEGTETLVQNFINAVNDPEQRPRIQRSLSALASEPVDLQDVRGALDLASALEIDINQFYQEHLHARVPQSLQGFSSEVASRIGSLNDTQRDRVFENLDILANGTMELNDIEATIQLAQDLQIDLSAFFDSNIKPHLPEAYREVASDALSRLVSASEEDRAKVYDNLRTLADGEIGLDDVEATLQLAEFMEVNLEEYYQENIQSRLPTEPVNLRDVADRVVGKLTHASEEDRAKVYDNLRTLADGEVGLDDVEASLQLAEFMEVDLNQFYQEHIQSRVPESLRGFSDTVVEKMVSATPEQRQQVYNNLRTLANDEFGLNDLESALQLAEFAGVNLNQFYQDHIQNRIPENVRQVAGDVFNHISSIDEQTRTQIFNNLELLANDNLGLEDLRAGFQIAEDLNLDMEQFYTDRIRTLIPEPLQGLADTVAAKALDAEDREAIISSLETLTANSELGQDDLEALGTLASVFGDELNSLYESHLQSRIPPALEGVASRFMEVASDETSRNAIINSISSLSDGEFDFGDIRAAAELAGVFGEDIRAMITPMIESRLGEDMQPIAMSLMDKVLDTETRTQILDNLNTLTDENYDINDLQAVAQLAQAFGPEAQALLQPAIDRLPDTSRRVAQVMLDTLTDPEKSATILSSLEQLTSDHAWDASDGFDQEIEDLKAVFAIAETVGVNLIQSGMLDQLVSRVPGLEMNFNEETNQLEMNLSLPGANGRGGSISANYDFSQNTYGISLNSGGYSVRGVEMSGSIAYRHSAESAGAQADDGTAVVRNRLEDLPDALREQLTTAAQAYGVNPENVAVVFQVGMDDEGNVTTTATLEAATGSDPERYQQIELTLDANVKELAEKAVTYLAEKYGPALAAKLGPIGLSSLSKAIPVAGQLLTAAQVGWEVGRFLGENVTIGDQTIDEHMQEQYLAIIQGEHSDSEAAEADFKAGVATLRNAYLDIVHGRPPLEPIPEGDPNREILEDLFAVKIMAYTAMARPESMNTNDRDNALSTLAELEERGVVTSEEAENLRNQLNLVDDSRQVSSDYRARVQESNYGEINEQLDQIAEPWLDSNAADIAIDLGRQVTTLLRDGQLTPERAEELYDNIIEQMEDRGMDSSEINSVKAHIANMDQSGDENRTSNTIGVEVGVAHWLENSRNRVAN